MYCWIRNVQKVFKPQCFREARKLTSSAAEHARQREYGLVQVEEVSGFIERCLVAAGAVQSHAASLASVLVHADVRGHYSHGLNRLGKTTVIEVVGSDLGSDSVYVYVRDVTVCACVRNVL
jgi:hypothetical protein